MYVRFEFFRDVAGYYRWRLVALNNEIVATSEAYVSKQGAVNTAKRIRVLAPSARLVDTTVSPSQFVV